MGGWEWTILFALVFLGIPALIVTLVVRGRRKAAAQQRAAFDQVFSTDRVSYQLAYGAPPYEAVSAEAVRRGYRLEQQSPSGLLTFTR